MRISTFDEHPSTRPLSGSGERPQRATDPDGHPHDLEQVAARRCADQERVDAVVGVNVLERLSCVQMCGCKRSTPSLRTSRSFSDTALRVRAATPSIQSHLSTVGYTADRDRYGLNVHFDAGEDHLSNPSLIRLLQELSSIGVCFALDFKQSVNPAVHVEMLIEGGARFDAPSACGFDGRCWLVQDYPWHHH